MLWSSFSIGDAYMRVLYGKAYVENGHKTYMCSNTTTKPSHVLLIININQAKYYNNNVSHNIFQPT